MITKLIAVINSPSFPSAQKNAACGTGHFISNFSE